MRSGKDESKSLDKLRESLQASTQKLGSHGCLLNGIAEYTNLNRPFLAYLSATFSMACKEFGVNLTIDISTASEEQWCATLSTFVHMEDCCKVSWLGLYNNDWTRSTVITIVYKWKQLVTSGLCNLKRSPCLHTVWTVLKLSKNLIYTLLPCSKL